MGDWTGESGVPWEPGTFLGNVAARTPRSLVNTSAGYAPDQPLSDDNYYRALYGLAYGGGSGGTTGSYGTQVTSRTGTRGRSGGAAAAPKLSQAQLDWAASLLKGGGPQQQQAGPAYNPGAYNAPQLTPFNDQRYTQLTDAFNQAVGLDRGTAQQAYGDLNNYLTTNYRNGFQGRDTANMGNAPGQSADAMQRMLAAQGQASDLGGNERNYAQGADQAFGNLLSVLGANEDQAQQARLRQVQMDQGTTNRALDIAALQGRTSIGQQREGAREQWQQRADDRSYDAYNNQFSSQQQAALANWQRNNTVSDNNTTSNNSYRNQVLTQLFALFPDLVQAGGLNLPGLDQLGLG